MSVRRDSNAPLYVQLKETLHEKIVQGEWTVGMELPSEQQLCETYGVSRTVVRQALDDLNLEGLIRKQRGKKTFVASAKLDEGWVHKVTGFHQAMVEKGHKVVTRVLAQELIPANAQHAAALNIAKNTSVIWIKRLRFVDGDPILLVDSYVPYALCPDLLNADLTDQSLYGYLESHGLVLASGQRVLEAIPANDYQAQLLQVERNAPLMLLDSVVYLDNGTPIECFRAVHRGDRTRFEVDLVRITTLDKRT